MMLSSKGNVLDMQKQTTVWGLNTKACKGIPSSGSTLYEKLQIDKTQMESEESKAIYHMLLLIKQRLECESIQKGDNCESNETFQDLSKFTLDEEGKSHLDEAAV